MTFLKSQGRYWELQPDKMREACPIRFCPVAYKHKEKDLFFFLRLFVSGKRARVQNFAR